MRRRPSRAAPGPGSVPMAQRRPGRGPFPWRWRAGRRAPGRRHPKGGGGSPCRATSGSARRAAPRRRPGGHHRARDLDERRSRLAADYDGLMSRSGGTPPQAAASGSISRLPGDATPKGGAGDPGTAPFGEIAAGRDPPPRTAPPATETRLRARQVLRAAQRGKATRRAAGAYAQPAGTTLIIRYSGAREQIPELRADQTSRPTCKRGYLHLAAAYTVREFPQDPRTTPAPSPSSRFAASWKPRVE